MRFSLAIGVTLCAVQVVVGGEVNVNGATATVRPFPRELQSSFSEVVCPSDFDDFDVPLGGLVFGDALDLCLSDDVRLAVNNKLPISVVLPFVRMETWAYTVFEEAPVTRLDYLIEGGATALVPGGQNADTLRTSIFNYTTGLFELVDQRATTSPFVDELITHSQSVDIGDYMQDADGEIRVRFEVFSPGDAASASWQLRLDRYEVAVTNTPLVETVCPGDAADFVSPFGGTVNGDALDLCASDDVRLRVRNRLPPSVLLPFVRVETWGHTTFAIASIVSIDYAVEGGVTGIVSGSQNADTMQTSIYNYDTAAFELVDQRATGSPFADELVTHSQVVDVANYVQISDSEIRVRVDAFSPGDVTNANWELRLDAFEVTVTDL